MISAVDIGAKRSEAEVFGVEQILGVAKRYWRYLESKRYWYLESKRSWGEKVGARRGVAEVFGGVVRPS